MKFTNKGGTVCVKIKVLDHQQIDESEPGVKLIYTGLQLSLTDTGIGITKEGITKLFGDFSML